MSTRDRPPDGGTIDATFYRHDEERARQRLGGVSRDLKAALLAGGR